MFSLRPYRSLRDDEEPPTVTGKSALYGGVEVVHNDSGGPPVVSGLHCQNNHTDLTTTTTTATTSTNSPVTTTTTTTTSSSPPLGPNITSSNHNSVIANSTTTSSSNNNNSSSSSGGILAATTTTTTTITTTTTTTTSSSSLSTSSSLWHHHFHHNTSNSSNSSSGSNKSSPLSLTSLKAAWRNLTSLGLGSSRLPHLERHSEVGIPEPHDYRYTHFPNNKRHHKETTFDETHIHLTPASRTYTHPHRSPVPPPPHHHLHHHHFHLLQHHNSSLGTPPPQPRGQHSVVVQESPTVNSSRDSNSSSSTLTLAKCLRKHREKQQARALTRKSKSDNALQKIGVNLKSHSDQNLHKVWLNSINSCSVGCSSNNSSKSNSVFSTVQLSGGSGDSCGSSGSGGLNSSFSCKGRCQHHNSFLQQQQHHHRSKSLERNQGTRIHPIAGPTSLSHHRHTRSLERNHKFRVDLRSLYPSSITSTSNSKDEPPEHQAPPPPSSVTPTHVPWAPDAAAVEGVSVVEGGWQAPLWVGGMEGGHAGGGGGSFINKPARGWLHPDHQLADEGICYAVRYIGCLEVNTSMKSLNFDTRSLIAKECISRVCESAGLKTDRKRKVVKTIGRILGERPLMEHAGSNVNLTITSTALTLTVLETGQMVACHDMPNISFASGGDPDTLDFIAYVAKDSRYGRACFVLECGGGLAQDVITTIGQAFELRFKEYLKRTPSVQYTSVKSEKPGVNGEGAGGGWNKDDPEYYNDLPGKVPPDLPPPPVPPLPQYSSADSKRPPPSATTRVSTPATPTSSSVSSSVSPPPTTTTASASSSSSSSTAAVGLAVSASISSSSSSSSVSLASTTPGTTVVHLNSNQQLSSKVSDNLIDFTCEGAQPPPSRSEPEYVNDAVIKQKQLLDQRDPFDMQPFSMQLSQLSGGGGNSGNTSGPAGVGASGTAGVPAGTVGGTGKPLPLNQRLQLQREAWFHGAISRKEAEGLLLQDGDFLVRESQGTVGQYVLTGMQNNTKKHLLLVDPEGVVRTKSRTFDSVSHLINYHRNNELPIVSAESALVLRNPVLRRLR